MMVGAAYCGKELGTVGYMYIGCMGVALPALGRYGVA